MANKETKGVPLEENMTVVISGQTCRLERSRRSGEFIATPIYGSSENSQSKVEQIPAKRTRKENRFITDEYLVYGTRHHDRSNSSHRTYQNNSLSSESLHFHSCTAKHHIHHRYGTSASRCSHCGDQSSANMSPIYLHRTHHHSGSSTLSGRSRNCLAFGSGDEWSDADSIFSGGGDESDRSSVLSSISTTVNQKQQKQLKNDPTWKPPQHIIPRSSSAPKRCYRAEFFKRRFRPVSSICSICHLDVADGDLLKDHVKANHPDVTSLKCKVCQFGCIPPEQMRNHYKEKHPDNLCTICGYTAIHPLLIAHHVSQDHSLDQSTISNNNNTENGCVAYNSASSISNHSSTTNDAVVKKYFADLSSWKQFSPLEPKTLFQCPLCDRQFSRRESALSHQIRHQKYAVGPRLAHCIQFPSNSVDGLHPIDLMSSESNESRCSRSTLPYKDNSLVQQRENSVENSNIPPATLSCSNSGGILMTNTNKGDNTSGVSLSSSSSTPSSNTFAPSMRTNISCCLCGFVSTNETAFLKHLKIAHGSEIETGERKSIFRCAYCTFSSYSAPELVAHSHALHEYECSRCGTFFNSSSSLQEHLQHECQGGAGTAATSDVTTECAARHLAVNMSSTLESTKSKIVDHRLPLTTNINDDLRPPDSPPQITSTLRRILIPSPIQTTLADSSGRPSSITAATTRNAMKISIGGSNDGCCSASVVSSTDGKNSIVAKPNVITIQPLILPNRPPSSHGPIRHHRRVSTPVQMTKFQITSSSSSPREEVASALKTRSSSQDQLINWRQQQQSCSAIGNSANDSSHPSPLRQASIVQVYNGDGSSASSQSSNDSARPHSRIGLPHSANHLVTTTRNCRPLTPSTFRKILVSTKMQQLPSSNQMSGSSLIRPATPTRISSGNGDSANMNNVCYSSETSSNISSVMPIVSLSQKRTIFNSSPVFRATTTNRLATPATPSSNTGGNIRQRGCSISQKNALFSKPEMSVSNLSHHSYISSKGSSSSSSTNQHTNPVAMVKPIVVDQQASSSSPTRQFQQKSSPVLIPTNQFSQRHQQPIRIVSFRNKNSSDHDYLSRTAGNQRSSRLGGSLEITDTTLRGSRATTTESFLDEANATANCNAYAVAMVPATNESLPGIDSEVGHGKRPTSIFVGDNTNQEIFDPSSSGYLWHDNAVGDVTASLGPGSFFDNNGKSTPNNGITIDCNNHRQYYLRRRHKRKHNSSSNNSSSFLISSPTASIIGGGSLSPSASDDIMSNDGNMSELSTPTNGGRSSNGSVTSSLLASLLTTVTQNGNGNSSINGINNNINSYGGVVTNDNNVTSFDETNNNVSSSQRHGSRSRSPILTVSDVIGQTNSEGMLQVDDVVTSSNDDDPIVELSERDNHGSYVTVENSHVHSTSFSCDGGTFEEGGISSSSNNNLLFHSSVGVNSDNNNRFSSRNNGSHNIRMTSSSSRAPVAMDTTNNINNVQQENVGIQTRLRQRRQP